MGNILFKSGATVRYGDVEIENIISSKVDTQYNKNEQGTDIKSVTHTFEFEAIVHPDNLGLTGRTSTDDALNLIRSELEKVGQTFVYEDKGFGSFTVGAQGNHTSIEPVGDVMFGPMPVRLVFEPFGQGKAARINWTVQVTVRPFCGETVESILGLEFWSSSSVKINQFGYQTLTRKGLLEIPSNRDVNNDIADRASDVYKLFLDNLLSPSSMEGYHLESSYDFSPDGRQLTFELIYTEIESPNAYPLGVESIQCSHSVNSSLLESDPLQGSAFRSWKNEMSCTVQLRPGIHSIRAWEVFAAIISDRLNQSVTVEFENIDGEDIVTRVRVPIILSMKLKEELFSHSATFSVTWIAFTQTIADIFNRSGLFKPYINPNETWNDWVVDMRNGVQNLDGAFPLTSLGETTNIYSFCNNGVEPAIPDTTRGVITVQVPAIFDPQCPPPESSWLDYQNKCELESYSARTVHRRFKEAADITRDETGSLDPAPFDESTSVSQEYDTVSNENDHLVQDFGTDKHVARLKGYAVRIGRPTEAPRLGTVGGRRAIINGDKSKVSSIVLSSNNVCPVHVTQWDLYYDVLGYPDGDIVSTTEVSISQGQVT